VVFFLRWHDAQLKHAETGVKQYPLGEIWHPEWVIVNESGSGARALPERANVTPDGTVTYHQRLVGTFAQVLDLRHFPFDRDTFRIHFVVAGYRPDEIRFVPEETAITAGLRGGAGIAPELSLQDWRVVSHATRVLPYRVTPSVEIAGYAFEFIAARVAWHFIVKVIIPLLLIVMMSWAVFWIEPTNNDPQFSIATTAMLTLIAYRFALDVEVPKLPYSTRLDAFVLMSTFLVFLSLIEVLVTTKLAVANRVALALEIDRCARWLVPMIFLIVSLVIFLRP
jgi:gamma-aminobutyric acid receptor subunit beta